MDKITLNFFHEKNAEEAYLPKYFVAKNIIMVTREPYWEDPRIIISPLYRGLINKVDQKQVILKEEGWQELKRCRLVQMDNPRFHEFMDSFHENLKKGNFKLGDILEATLYNGKLIIFKAKPHHSKMKFDDPKQAKEDQVWANEDFGEWDA